MPNLPIMLYSLAQVIGIASVRTVDLHIEAPISLRNPASHSLLHGPCTALDQPTQSAIVAVPLGCRLGCQLEVRLDLDLPLFFLPFHWRSSHCKNTLRCADHLRDSKNAPVPDNDSIYCK